MRDKKELKKIFKEFELSSQNQRDDLLKFLPKQDIDEAKEHQIIRIDTKSDIIEGGSNAELA
jgi:hypothetical protein